MPVLRRALIFYTCGLIAFCPFVADQLNERHVGRQAARRNSVFRRVGDCAMGRAGCNAARVNAWTAAASISTAHRATHILFSAAGAQRGISKTFAPKPSEGFRSDCLPKPSEAFRSLRKPKPPEAFGSLRKPSEGFGSPRKFHRRPCI